MKRLLLAVATIVSAVLAGCQAPGSEGIDISHVHGLAYNPEEDAVFVATHHGLAKGSRSGTTWTWTYVGNERFDYMGFTQDGADPGTFYSSGHPDDPYAFGATHLGLRRSVDGGESWDQRSLKGQVDFHALTGLPGKPGSIAGAWQGAVKVSRDAGATWGDHPGPPAHVLALTADSKRLLAGTTDGLYGTSDLEEFGGWVRLTTPSLPAFVSALATSPDGLLMFAATGNGQSGSTYRSSDGGATWTELSDPALKGAVAPVIVAVDRTDSQHVFASTASAHILESGDAGVTWRSIRLP